ncbi:MAG: hypothetical protein KGJ78_05850 [Alphaproteobacteria bacterium]|nr:hypothetical protein [Alphaproteobacteria bacterium]
MNFAEKFLKPRYIALSAALAVFAVLLFAPAVLHDGDTYTHIAAGRWMLDNRAVLRIDPFSYTFAGHPWLTHEWLAEVAMALTYIVAGWNGLVLLFAIVAGFAAWSLARHLSRWLGGLALTVTVILSICCMTGTFLVRPHLLAWPLLEIWAAELIIAAEAVRRPPLWLLPLMVVWANIHASFVFGLALLIPMALEDAVEHGSWSKAARHWGLFAVLAVGAALLTPHGLDGLLFPFKLMAIPQLYLITEWRPLDVRLLEPPVLVMGFALFACLSRGVKIKPVRLLVLLGLVYLGLAQVRDLLLLAVVGPLVLARPLSETLGEGTPAGWQTRRRPILVFAALFAVLAGVRLYVPVVRSDGPATPATALAHVPAALIRQPVLNDYAFGGFLIFNDLRPFIDGRAELYGGPFIARYVDMMHGDPKAVQATLAKYRIRWAILSPANGAIAVIDGLPGWHRVYADRWAVVQVKDAR